MGCAASIALVDHVIQSNNERRSSDSRSIDHVPPPPYGNPTPRRNDPIPPPPHRNHYPQYDPTPRRNDPIPPPPHGNNYPQYDPTPRRNDPIPPTPPPRYPTPPPPQPQYQRDLTPAKRDPTPPPPRDPTPPRFPKQVENNKGKRIEGYTHSEYGIHEKSLDFRKHPEDLDRDFANRPPGRPYTDHDFGAQIAIKGTSVQWMRPREFAKSPVLFSDGTTRYDIGQGSAGTCWFLSTVAMLADKPALFHRVVEKNAWDEQGGVFHCRFWRFGEWEDVYIDDYLPIVHGTQLWGAKSKDDPNEMWPALLEKAFARFHGSYNAVYGGNSGDAFLALTGGCSEHIDFDDELVKDAIGGKIKKARILHRRLKNAVTNDCFLTTVVPNEHDGKCGLVGGHAYSLTDAKTVKNNQGNEVHLVRVRNPWGHTEWTGAWSDGSRDWQTIPPNTVKHAKKDDGEFWISLADFVKYFSGIYLCSMTPDFDKDGCTDSINVCTTMFGDWVGKTAAGFQNKTDNPKYQFSVDDEGKDEDGCVPLVIQICQKLKHRKKNKASIRVDLYKVLGEQSGKVVVLEEIGSNNGHYKTDMQMTNRFSVAPGSYVAVPSTMKAGTEKEFLVRVFSPNGLQNVRAIDSKCVVMQTSEFQPPDSPSVDNNLRTYECIFGAWRTGFNAGGQVSRPTFFTNPQIEFEIQDKQQMVNLTLMQQRGSETFPIGVQLFDLVSGYSVSRGDNHQHYLCEHYEKGPKTVDGEAGKFVNGNSASATYVFHPGRYLALLHMDTASQQTNFAFIVKSAGRLDMRKHNFE